VEGVHLGAIGIEVGGVDLRPCDDARSILCDLVMHGTGLSTPGRTTPGAAIPALGSIGIVGLWVARLPLLGPPPSALHSNLSTGDRSRTAQNTRVHRLPPWRGYCERCWAWSTGISFIRFMLDGKRGEHLPEHLCLPLSSIIHP
jgi:hypothetical protein